LSDRDLPFLIRLLSQAFQLIVEATKQRDTSENSAGIFNWSQTVSLSESPRHWPPLGMPVGSVRAILTLFVVGVVVASVARGQKLEILWTETLLIAMAHYFTARRFVALSPDVLKRLQQEGVIEKEANPLWLPRHSIRIIILAAFSWLGYELFEQKRLTDTEAVSMVGIVAAYVAGSFVRVISGWVTSRTNRPPSSAWGDFKAIVVLTAVIAVGIFELSGANVLPPYAHRIALCMMLFYFGSR
jgi:hypothetical protein